MEFSSVVLVGFGYTGRYIYKELEYAGVDIYGVCRRKPEGMERLLHLEYDLDSGEGLPVINWREAGIIYMAPPNSRDGEDLRVKAFLGAIEGEAKKPKSMVYFSTTGVYGDCDGGWVDEESEVKAVSERTAARLDAEGQFGDFCKRHGIALKILRVAGIYGPGRLGVERLERGDPVVQRSEAPFINRIHVEDLAVIAVRALKNEGEYAVYNVSDGDPRLSVEYYGILAEVMSMEDPVEVPMVEVLEQASPMMREFLTNSKRVRNDKVLGELGVKLRYGTVEEGVRASAF